MIGRWKILSIALKKHIKNDIKRRPKNEFLYLFSKRGVKSPGGQPSDQSGKRIFCAVILA